MTHHLIDQLDENGHTYYLCVECKDEFPTPDMVSNCCDARIHGYDICAGCKEHCEPVHLAWM